MRAAAHILSADEAVAAIPSGATVAVSGFVGAGHPEMLTAALERRFLQTSTPTDLTLYYCAGQGDREGRGLNHLAHRGMLKRIVGGHWNLAPKLGALALANEVEAYNLPQGVLSVLTREIAAKRPGLITKVGLNTFIDPIHGGGMLNARTTEPLVERIELDGETWLRYKPMPIHVALIRATYADARGNLSMECEGLISEVLPMAQAAKNHGGIVIAQVESVVDQLPDPKAVRVPGLLVDYIVTSAGVQHDQTFGEVFNEDFVVTGDGNFELPGMPESERKRIGTRAVREIREGDIVNLGIGLPEAVAMVAAETGRLQEFTLTVESGPTGGVPASGLSFGCSHFPEAVIDQPSQFDFYDGGGLDIAVLGAVEIDAEGSVNVASFADRFAGVGGFMNIAQSARRLVFCCTFQAKGNAKFVRQLQHVCFHGPSALARNQQVLYVTERAVFELTPHGLRLIEIAAGLDLQRDVLDLMQFAPQLAETILTIP
jgi:propionate CoA-transferase|uniref:acyl CoA:acetate/3-ketoacid CoA transferase n=1 Tax=Prosthecobacter sp. TaxID=1965333 RepID=UPI003782EC4B